MPLKKLLDKAAALTLTEDETATLASRLAKLELELTPEERTELDTVAGRPVRDLDPRTRRRRRPRRPGQAHRAPAAALQSSSSTPPSSRSPPTPTCGNRILELRATHDRVIDEVSNDVLLDAHGVVDPGRAKSIVDSWRAYLDEHRSEITAIQLLGEAKDRRIAFDDIQELADRIARPPYNWTPDIIWNAYVAIDGTRGPAHPAAHPDRPGVPAALYGRRRRRARPVRRPRPREVRRLAQPQDQAGVTFGDKERWWLDRMVSVIASSAGITADDLDDAPFTERGGTDGALRDLGDRAADLIDELNAELTA